MPQTKLKYCIYARKSTESEERQVQSIADQIKIAKEIALHLGLSVVKTYTEAKSGGEPGIRPVYKEMMQAIKDGELDGILCWRIDRLSRNPIDSGEISWLLQKGIIKIIQTPERQYLPNDNVLLLNVETGMANQYILDLRKNVMRGIESKLQKGWYPCLPPLGYLNDRINKTIIDDPERFSLIRKAWDLMLTGNYTPPQILDLINEEWGFRTRKLVKLGERKMAKSSIYKILTNIFYTGVIKYDGKQYPGKHKPMITLEEYDRVQYLLGQAGKPRSKTHEFAFTGIIRCGECGCIITAETKQKFIKSLKTVRDYTYYRCTRQKVGHACKQLSITLPELEQQIDEELAKFTILPEFKDWALEDLNKHNDTEIEDRSKVYENQHKALAEAQKQLDGLTKMRYRELINDEEFIKERDALRLEIKNLSEKLHQTEQRAERWLDLTEKAFEFATHARIAFMGGDLKTKGEILRTIGVELILTNRELRIKPQEWLQPIVSSYPALQSQYLTLELNQSPLNKAKTELLNSVRAQWWAGKDSNLRRRKASRFTVCPR